MGRKSVTTAENPDIRRSLHGIVNRFARGLASREDLMQEALICWWRLEQDRPGQTEAWYLTGCRYHLQNHLRQGRSVDSGKHGWARLTWPNPFADDTETPHTNGAIWEEISANDILRLLNERLEPAERDALLCLADGLSAREIAARQNVSHTIVNRRRQKIAAVALTLGVAPVQRPKRRTPLKQARDQGGCFHFGEKRTYREEQQF